MNIRLNNTMRRAIIMALLFCALLPDISKAQAQNSNITFSHISDEQGLSNNTIEAIAQDHRGFIWIGTRDGLNLYDGRQMKVFRTVPGFKGAISDNYIKCIYEDRQQNLWIGTRDGLNRYDAARQTFTRFLHIDKNSTSLPHNEVNCLLEDRQGNLWAGTANGLAILDRAKGRFSRIKLAGATTVNALFEDKAGALWVAAQDRLFKYNPAKRMFTLALQIQGNIKAIQQDKTGDLWLATESSGLLRYNTRTAAQTYYQHDDARAGSLGNDMILALLVDANGTIMAGTINGGLNIFNEQSGTFTKYTYDPGVAGSISQRTISCVFQDRQGNYWIGTHRGGLNLYSPASKKFNLYRQEANGKGLSYNDVKCFEEDHKRRIWVGTDGGGLNLFDRGTSSFKAYRNTIGNPRSLASDAVLDITEDRDRRLWIATWGGGLNLFNPESGLFTHYKNNPGNATSISSNFVQNVFQDRNGVLWIGTYFGGLNSFDPETGKFKRITTGSDGRTRLQGNNIVAINEDTEGNLWIGTDDDGLNRYSADRKHFTNYFDGDAKKPDIRVIFCDSKGRLWIGQSGLWLFDKARNRFELFSKDAGLERSFIKGITEDEQGSLWVSTSSGLIKLNPQTRQVNKYNTADGLQAMEFEANAYMRTRNGEMFFGGIDGFNTFYPQQIRNNPFIPPIYITGFEIFNKAMYPGVAGSPLQKDISLTREIILSYKQSSLTFTFAALNYLAPQNNRYAYKLTGFDPNYSYTTANKAIYTNLDPGEYTFEVKAANNDGVWNNKPVSVKVIINPPWWLTWWFKLLAAVMASVAAFVVIRYRHNQEVKKLEEAKREELHQLQLQFFTNISHEFRTPLTLILGPLEKLVEAPDTAENAHAYHIMYRNARRLMHLINELMDFRKAESGTLSLKVSPGNMPAFLDEIADEFSIWAEQKHINFSIEHTDLPGSDIYFDRQVLEKILLNLINNAFKYTNDGGTVKVSLYFSEDRFTPSHQNELKVNNDYQGKRYMHLLVADTGIGISAESIQNLFQRYYRITSSHLGSGIGLAFVKTLTLLHKGCIKVYSERHKGTEILVSIPVDSSDYTAAEHWLQNSGDTANGLNSENYPAYEELPDVFEENEQQPLYSKHILLVEDNDELRDFLRDALGTHYTIIEASDGEEGLALAREHFPNAIISDIMMPGMNGIELCRNIKEDEATRHIPFILLSAKDALESRLEGVGSGADFYFSKPLSINLLLLTMRNIFTQQEKLKERYTTEHQTEIKEHVHTSKDKQFADQLVALIESQLSNPALDVDYLCRHLNMSRTKLYENIKRLTGQSIVEFIRTVRLNKAKHIITHEDVSLSEVILRVGIQTQSYFTKAFKKEFGKTPSQFISELNGNPAVVSGKDEEE